MAENENECLCDSYGSDLCTLHEGTEFQRLGKALAQITEIQRRLKVAEAALADLEAYGERWDEMSKADGILEPEATGYVYGTARAALAEIRKEW